MHTTGGYPRIYYEGYSYGHKKRGSESRNHKNVMRWVCTADDGNKKRCGAALVSKIINGYMMMRVAIPTHICTPKIPYSRRV